MKKSPVNGKTLLIDTPTLPPSWALLERELIRVQTLACQEFFNRYFDERGYLLCLPRWGGNDGPDDAIENWMAYFAYVGCVRHDPAYV